MTNPWTFVIIIAVVSIFITIIMNTGADLATNPNANLDNKSYEYILYLYGANESQINDLTGKGIFNDSGFTDATVSEVGESQVAESGETGGTIKDFAIEFFWARTKAGKVERALRSVLTFPTTILKILRLPIGMFDGYLGIINAVLWLAFILAIYFLVRGILAKK